MLIDTNNLYMINLYQNLLEKKLKEDHGLRTGFLKWDFFPKYEALQFDIGKVRYSDEGEIYQDEEDQHGEIKIHIKPERFELSLRIYSDNDCGDDEPLFTFAFDYKRYRSDSVDVDGVANRIAWELEHAVITDEKE